MRRKSAAAGGDKFAGVLWSHGRNEAQALDGVLATIEAEFEHATGDHVIVVARVTNSEAHEGRRPLLSYRRTFGGFACP